MRSREALARFLHKSTCAGGVDFHLHSDFSDGRDSVATIAKKAKAHRLRACSLTDHDTMSGIPDMRHALDKTDIRLIPGIECSTEQVYFSKSGETIAETIHILGYFTDDQPPAMTEFVAAVKRRRHERNLKMLRRMQSRGFDIPDHFFEADSGHASVSGRVNAARWLVDHGHYASLNEAFALELGEGCPSYVKKEHMTTAHVLSTIRHANGVAVLAHPHQYGFCPQSATEVADDRTMRGVVDELTALGLDGIECFHGTCPASVRSYLWNLTVEKKLIATQGSDDHGDHGMHAEMYDRETCFVCVENVKNRGRNRSLS